MRDTKSSSSPGKLTLTSLACAALGTITVLGIGFGVFSCVSALTPANQNSTALAAGSAQQLDLSDPNIRVTYGADGTMYVDVYVHDNVKGAVVNSPEADKPAKEEAAPLDQGGDTQVTPDTSKPDTTDVTDETTAEDEQSTEETIVSDNDTDTEEVSTGDDATVEATPGAEGEGLTERESEILDSGKYMEDDTVYTVVSGDTLTKISHMSGFSVDFLAAYNHIADKNLIITGECIRYPSTK